MINRRNTNILVSLAFGVVGVAAGVLGTTAYYKSGDGIVNTKNVASTRDFSNQKEKESYSLGVMIAQQVQSTLTMGQMEVDNRSFINGLEDSILQNTIPFSSDEIAQNVVNLQESANSTAKSHLENKALDKQSDLFTNGSTPNLGTGEITLVEFFDYNCPHCRSLNSTMKDFVQNNNVRVLYRPIGLVSKGSQAAAVAALAAHKQNKFKEVHEALMATDKEITEELVNEIISKVNLDNKQFEQDLKSSDVEQQASNNRKIFLELGLRGVPSVFAAKLDADNKVSGNSLIYLSGDSSGTALLETVNKLR